LIDNFEEVIGKKGKEREELEVIPTTTRSQVEKFIRQLGDQYGIDDWETWRIISEYSPDLHKKLKQIARSFERHPRSLDEGRMIKKEVDEILRKYKDVRGLSLVNFDREYLPYSPSIVKEDKGMPSITRLTAVSKLQALQKAFADKELSEHEFIERVKEVFNVSDLRGKDIDKISDNHYLRSEISILEDIIAENIEDIKQRQNLLDKVKDPVQKKALEEFIRSKQEQNTMAEEKIKLYNKALDIIFDTFSPHINEGY